MKTTYLFPKGLWNKIIAYRSGWRTSREAATEFKSYGVTREMLIDIAEERATIEEADVDHVILLSKKED